MKSKPAASPNIEPGASPGQWQIYTEYAMREDNSRFNLETTGFQQTLGEIDLVEAATCWLGASLRLLFDYDELLACLWDESMLPRSLEVLLEDQARAEPAISTPKGVAARVQEWQRVYKLDRLRPDWKELSPPGLPSPAPVESYGEFRRAYFKDYLETALKDLPPEWRDQLNTRHAAMRREQLPAFQQQLTVLKTLKPGRFEERVEPLPLPLARLALVVGERYYLLDACQKDGRGRWPVFSEDDPAADPTTSLSLDGSTSFRDAQNQAVQVDRSGWVWRNGQKLGRVRPPTLDTIKSQVRAIFNQAEVSPGDEPASEVDLGLAGAPRSLQPRLRGLLSSQTQAELAALAQAPVILNFDRHDGDRPLASLRQTRRGIGDHALTLIRTHRSMVFDLSHIFFDAAGGANIIDLLTGFATALYPTVSAAGLHPVPKLTFLALQPNPAFSQAAKAALETRPVEVTAETKAVDLGLINRLRGELARQGATLTVNDLLTLARGLHEAFYRPGPAAQQALSEIEKLKNGPRLKAEISRHLGKEGRENGRDQAAGPGQAQITGQEPDLDRRGSQDRRKLVIPNFPNDRRAGQGPLAKMALSIPIDANPDDPRQRLYSTVFQYPAPLALDQFPGWPRGLPNQDEAALAEARREVLADLRAFSKALRENKAAAQRDPNPSIRVLNRLPRVLRPTFNSLVEKFAGLSDTNKGREIFSNLGRVSGTSSLARFTSARDFGRAHRLAWGIMTTAEGSLVITLRDYRQILARLVRQGRPDLAQALTQDYLDTYAATVNKLAQGLQSLIGAEILSN